MRGAIGKIRYEEAGETHNSLNSILRTIVRALRYAEP